MAVWYLTPQAVISAGVFNSLAPGKFEWNLRHVILKQILVIDGWVISREIALIWISLVFTDDQSTLVRVMAWCRQATSHYLSQWWPWSLSPCGITRPQWVNSLAPVGCDCNFNPQATQYFFQNVISFSTVLPCKRNILYETGTVQWIYCHHCGHW